MPEFIPTDPLFANQWYLRNTGQTGFGSGTLDLNVTEVWPDYTGAGVTIAVYDNGVDYNHQDLNDNYDASLHVIIDGNPSDAFWLPPGSVGGSTGFNAFNAHGTLMAGIAAAENNGVGSVGVAFDATLVGVYTPILGQSTPSSQLVQALQQLDNFDVALFASGGPTFSGGSQNPNWIPVYDALQAAVTDGRGGLGTNILNSVHNNGPGFGGYDTNASQWDSSRFVTHVGGVNDEGVVVPNAVRSAAMHVSGFTGFQATAVPPGSPRNIIGTDITGADGAVPGDYASAGGTTSAVSQIAGVTALMLEANPDLGWRDVQSILVDAARHTGSAVGGPPNVGATETDAWEFNAAGDWNGGGRHYSIDYGYGIVDALAAVRLAETWLVGAPAATSANEASSVNPITPGNLAIPDNTGNSLTLTFNVTDDIEIESVQLRLGFNHTRAQDLQIVVTSPDGTASTILHPITTGTNNVTGNGWRMNSQEFRGEHSAGTWTVTITDTVSGNTGSLVGNSALVFFGTSDTTNDRYVYTNEFSAYAALPGRNTLTDTDGGTDTINAAAVTGNSTIDLNNGATSTIAGQAMTIANGSDIENAIGGDGNEMLTGNGLANVLYGGRGDDTFTGGAADDTLFGNAGDDTAMFSGNFADYLITETGAGMFDVADQRGGSPDGIDALAGVENATFADGTFNLAALFNDAPTITSNGGGANATINLDEGTTAVTTVTATDPDGPSLVFSIEGGADETLFDIDAVTGALTFIAAPDFEAPVGGDNSYEVVVRASDGTLFDDQAITVNVTNANDVAPAITSNGGGDTATVTIDENTTAVTTVTATDADGPSLTFSVEGGADEALFAIDAVTGALTFISAPDFEAGDNSYEVIVRASDGTLSDDQTITVNVTNVNDAAPAITSNGGGATAMVTVDENTTAVTSVTADDADGPSLTFSMEGGADEALFDIDPVTGALTFVMAPDFEAGDNSYEVIVRASDGTLFDDQTITVNVTNVNDVAPAITSNGGGATASVTVDENTTAVTTVTATDADSPAPAFSIVGGADQSRFTINPTTGALAFIAPPDFEAPDDAGADNSYEVVVRASDGTLSDDQAITVNVSNVNDAPAITSNGGGATASVTVNENITAVTTVTAVDADGPSLTFSIEGGADQALFDIDAVTGALMFIAAPDFEAGDNSYEVMVRASDGTLFDEQTITVNVTNENDVTPAITSNGGGATATVSVAENTTAVTAVTATDADGPSLTFSLAGGADEALFDIDAVTGALTFVTAPDFETGDNSYEVVVRASDGTLFDDQTITVNVSNVNDAPAITSNGGTATASVTVDENTTAVTTVTATDADGPSLTFSLEGGADEALFAIDAVTGVLTFVTAPDFEAGDNSYEVIVRASDGTLSDDQTITVNVSNVNDVAPAITSNGGGAAASVTVDEGTTAVTTVTAVDADGPAPAFSIVRGADQARFTINAITGALSFITAPDFAAPADADGNNSYEVVVRASDGTLSDDQTITVDVTDVATGGNEVAAVGDILWQHDDGTVATASQTLGIVGPNWQIAATGDFDGDGDGDIVWRHDDGLTVVWEMEGGNYLVNHNLGIVGTTWQIAGTGDFDADGDSDILWRHDDGQVVTWEMEGGNYVQNHNLAAVSHTWEIAGTGDFDGDGDADVLWHHDDGQVVTWEMENGNYVQNHNLASASVNWQIREPGDFDGDGDADIMWRHNEGQVVTWEMEDGEYLENHNIADVPTNWQTAGTWDFDSDGDSDVLWRHNDGSVVTWAMEDGGIWQTQNFGIVSNAWQIRGTGQFDLA